ncbi:aminoglycoside phosphotransferase family protein [Streptomyces sp. B22F1]|uniref:aminoglycoside phosphotransferase family protein n=1 Tax=Streptomyces sp. B22F1 TaxID=3153566 RepID=UPI00325E03F9
MTASGVEPVVARACAELLAVGAAASRRLKLGTRSAVYRVALADQRQVVVKVFASTARRNAMTEARVIGAAALFVPVPAVLGAGPVPGHSATALVTADLGELTLDAAVETGRISRRQELDHLGELLRRFHQIPIGQAQVAARPLAEHVSWLARHCPSALLNRIEPALQVLATASAGATGLILGHGDLHSQNVIFSESHLGLGQGHVIDFVHTAPCIREFDVAQTLTLAGAVEADEREEITEAYGHPLNAQVVDAAVAFHTTRCWVTAGRDGDEAGRAEWGMRLRCATERTPYLFRRPALNEEGSRR